MADNPALKISWSHSRHLDIIKMVEETPGIPLILAMERLLKTQQEENGIHGDAYTGDVKNYKALAEWISGQPNVTKYLSQPWVPVSAGDSVFDGTLNKKINAIKEVRLMTYAGLKEAKDAVEWYCHVALGYPEPSFSYINSSVS